MKERIKCIIVEDEPLAQRVLEKYITSLTSLELAKKCNNALEAAAFLHRNKVDLIFLDIKMPELTGMDFLKTLSDPPAVIITTAYAEYALEGYEYSVIDYLLKPVSFERFLKAVNKVIKMLNTGTKNAAAGEEAGADFIFLKSDKINHKIHFAQIDYIEGCGNYIKVFFDDRMIIVSERMSAVEKSLPPHRFVRTHKSYIAAVNKIEQVGGSHVRIKGKNIPVGSVYKMRLNEILEKYKLNKA
jgi:DNA-binding LytR/AlgR family response regulator